MQKEIKQTIFGYYQFFYRIMGNKLLFTMFLGLAVSFLDGIGLALFIPLLQFIDNAKSVSKESLGGLHYIIDLFEGLNVPLNIYSVLVLMVSLFSLKGLLNYFQLMQQVSLRQIFMVKLRNEQTEDLQNLKYSGFLGLDAGKIQNTLTTEVAKVIEAMINFLGSFKGMVMLFSYLVLAFLSNWQFALLVAVGGLLSNLVFRGIFRSVKKSSVEVSHKGHIFNAYIIQAVHSFKYLKATNYYRIFALKLKDIIKQMEQVNRKIGYNQAITSSVREPFIIFIVAVVIILQIKLLGSNLGSIILSILLFYRALVSLMAVQTSWQTFIQNVGALYSLEDLRYQMLEHKEHQSETSLDKFEQEISMNNLDFSYGSNQVLKKVNIKIPKNKTIALVGESGSGKTTLANLITGLIEPIDGEILIDGVSLFNYNLDSYRSRIGYISQEAVIFTDDIFNNITFWAEPTEENLKRFWTVIEQTSLTGFIEGLEHKEKTQLGDNGILISGGQKQRISIARELYKEADILIFDEATSALDSETERYIQDNIEKLHGQYTMVIIAHRLSTIKNADIIYLLESGVVTGSGNFNEMIDISPRFKKMVSLQEF
ncbi:ABC transporter ATP-binding protein/permease [Pedobacter sp. MC2016-14]|uniref:ABC transporter ATP-binding protein n=1 Tax=Pedobacter sp. MC2016-14 TaxID=2897327 RepID=UPI001E3E0D39|nr:ABC transporter ATP-binding protein [Pedobacter sp. MC2016-14]MCD0486870.1 ABC transporter ATP-binding protein/permease [Pedobacter sp. MC2016-14]